MEPSVGLKTVFSRHRRHRKLLSRRDLAAQGFSAADRCCRLSKTSVGEGTFGCGGSSNCDGATTMVIVCSDTMRFVWSNAMRVSLLFWSITAAAALVLGLVVAPQVRGDEKDEKKSDLPVKRVVLFSSGVAFYEHNGDVEGNATVDLKFNVRDINDLLKSMVLQDLGGGKVSTVSYGSKDPITRTLQTFSIDLTSNPTLADLLRQVRGEKIEIDAPTKIAGIIIGVETRKVPVGKSDVIDVPFLNLLTDEGLRSVSLENVGKIKLANPKLDAELRQALMVLATAKSTDKKAVSLSFKGDGKRAVRVGYVQESPIWKTSYRLVLEDEKKPFLQGWAIVENTTEADWNNVDLTLVSGRPISFVMDLYQPLYVGRPVVVPELYASLRPRTYDQDLAGAEADFRKAADGRPIDAIAANSAKADEKARFAAPGAPGNGQGGGFGGRGASSLQERLLKQAGEGKGEAWNLASGGQSLATASDVGEMFRYVIATPVTLARSKSAMLPIVNDSVEGEKVVIYNESQHPKHPLNGLRLKNTTDLHLMQGPITVFDDGAYAGDAQIQDLPPKSERLISYAMDLDTEVAITGRQDASNLVSLTLAKGNAIITHKHTRSRTYTVKNSGRKAKKTLIEYPLEANWNLVEPKEAEEKTRNMYRFAVQAEPGKPATLVVKEEFTASQSVAITNWDDNTIAFYRNAKEVSEDVKKALAEVVKRKAEIQQVVAKRQEVERQIQIIDVEQTRIRGNMAQLEKGAELFRRYEAKFTKQEDEIEKLRDQVTASVAQETKLRQSLDQYLLGLELK
jgi:hypothetical protein